MGGFFSEEQIEEVRRANDIVDVIKEYVPLKRAGKDFKALCPFHSEKTASFQVSPSKQIFKCFGCGKGGNVFSFVMATERLEFPEAVEHLARRAGIQLEKRPEALERGKSRDQLFDLNFWAAKVFHRCLTNSEEGQPGRDYFSSRGLTQETWTKFRLGYAPQGWDFLVNLSGGSGWGLEDFAAAGLTAVRPSGSGQYDRFRNRVIFPIFDVRGRVMGFGGRALDDSPPKYLNSPETSVFSKGSSLYGLDAAKDGIVREDRVVVVEGYVDCVTSHQFGVDFVVATLGTALTAQHISTLRRYTENMVLLFDGDDAGRKAAERSSDLFLEQEVDVRVVLLPPDKDPDELLQEEGRDAFLRRLDSATEVFDLKMQMIRERHDLSRLTGQREAIDEVLETLAKTNPLRQDMLFVRDAIKRLCAETGVSETSLRDRLKALVHRTRIGGGVVPNEKQPPRALSAEREVLGAVLSDPSLAPEFHAAVKPGEFGDESLQRIAEAVRAAIEADGTLDVQRVCDRLGDDALTQLVVDLETESAAKGSEKERFAAAVRILESERRKREIADLRRQIADAQARGDMAVEVELLNRYRDLTKRTAVVSEGDSA